MSADPDARTREIVREELAKVLAEVEQGFGKYRVSSPPRYSAVQIIDDLLRRLNRLLAPR